MRKNKLNDFEIYLGIDTFSMRSKTETTLKSKDIPFVAENIRKSTRTSMCYYKLNPDKAISQEIYHFSSYKGALKLMNDILQLENPVKTRLDFKIDSFDNNYNALLKLNKLLILLLCEQYRLKNRYESRDPLTLENLTIRAQNSRLEIENYNKAIEEPNGNVKNRLELRAKNLNNGDEETEFHKWCERLKKSATPQNFNKVLNKLTSALVDKYNSESSKIYVSEFLYKYENSIFSTVQLADFYRRLGYKDPEQQAKKYKRRRKIECFSLRDIQLYIDKITSSGKQFFET